MASAAQIEANRRNAQKSSGPKTEKGKARVRCNALKHDMTAVTTMPGLTHEDPDQLREKTLRLINDLQPSNEAELDQVCQAARLTLAIERADRFEMAHMNQRIREAARERVQEVNPRLRSRRCRSLAAGCSTSRRRKRSSSPGSRSGPTTRGCWSPSSKPAPPRAAAGCWRRWMGRHVVLRIGPAIGIHEMAVGQAQPLGFLVLPLGEGFHAAGQRFGDDDAGIVARLHDDALEQILERDLVVQLDEHLRALGAPGALGDGEAVGQFDLARLQILEDADRSSSACSSRPARSASRRSCRAGRRRSGKSMM